MDSQGSPWGSGQLRDPRAEGPSHSPRWVLLGWIPFGKDGTPDRKPGREEAAEDRLFHASIAVLPTLSKHRCLKQNSLFFMVLWNKQSSSDVGQGVGMAGRPNLASSTWLGA